MSNEYDILQYAADNGMLDIVCLQQEIEMKKRKEKIENYKYKIWQGSNKFWYTYIDRCGKKTLVKKKDLTDIEDLIVASINSPTVKSIFEESEAYRLEMGKIAESTAFRDKKIFKRHFDEFGNQEITYVTGGEICEFLERQLAKHHLTAKAFSNLKTIVRQIFKYGKKKGYVTFSIEEVLSDLDVSDREFKKVVREDDHEVYNEDELDALMEYLKANIDIVNLGILLLCVTGMRVGELVSLKNSDIVSDSIINIRRSETYYKKDGKYIYEVKDWPKTDAGIRSVVIPEGFEWILKRIRMMNPFSEFLFMRNGKRITASTVRDRLTVINEKLGITQKSPHKIRKTYGTILLARPMARSCSIMALTTSLLLS